MTETVFADMMKRPEAGFDAMAPENVSPLVVWLGSAQSREVTGRVFEVSGGSHQPGRRLARRAEDRPRRALGDRRDRRRRARAAAQGRAPSEGLRDLSPACASPSPKSRRTCAPPRAPSWRSTPPRSRCAAPWRASSASRPSCGRRSRRRLGWTAVCIPEDYGGLGLGAVELAALLEVMGEALLCAPFFSSVCLGANALLVAGSDAQKRELLPGDRRGPHARDAGGVRARQSWSAGGIEAVGAPPGRRLPALRPQALRARRPLRGPARGRRAPRGEPRRRRHLALRGPGPRPRASSGARSPPSTRPGASPRSSCTACACPPRRGSATRIGRGGAGAHPRARRHLAGGRAGGRRAALPRPRGGARQDARPVRPPDRLLPGDPAQVRRHDAAGRVGALGRLLRGLRRGRGRARARARRLARQGLLLRRLLPVRGRLPCRSTAASASPGSTTCTCTSSAPSGRRRFLGDPAWHRERVARRIGL